MPIVVADRTFKGFSSDSPRDMLPRGYVYRLKDWIPGNGAELRKRGGWVYASELLEATTEIAGAIWAEYYNAPQLVVVTSTGEVYSVETFSSSGGTSVGTVTGQATRIAHPLFTHTVGGILYVIILRTGNAIGWEYDGTNVQVIVSTQDDYSPTAGCSWSGYLLGANFGGGGGVDSRTIRWHGPDSWTNDPLAFWEMPAEIVAITAFWRSIIVFGHENTWILRGTTPPPGGDLEERLLFGGIGCMDPRSVVKYGESAIWCSSSGIYRTDAVSLQNLTGQAEIDKFWRDTVTNFNLSIGWTCTAGVYRGRLFVTVLDDSDAIQADLVYDFKEQAWSQWTNVPALCYAQRASSKGTGTAPGHEEMFFGSAAEARVGSLGDCWLPTSANAADADGTVVLPEIELPFYRLASSIKRRIRRAWLTYYLQSASGSPTLQMAFAISPEATSYTNCPEVFPETAARGGITWDLLFAARPGLMVDGWTANHDYYADLVVAYSPWLNATNGVIQFLLPTGFTSVFAARVDSAQSSGASEPDWASVPNLGDAIVDSDYTWVNCGTLSQLAPISRYAIGNDYGNQSVSTLLAVGVTADTGHIYVQSDPVATPFTAGGVVFPTDGGDVDEGGGRYWLDMGEVPGDPVEQRRHASIRRMALGSSFKITQTAASDDTRIYGLEIEGHAESEVRG